MIDCAGGEWLNGGCNGGWYGNAYDYLISHKLETEDDYGAYKARDGTCEYQSDKGVVNVASFSSATNYTDVGRPAIINSIATHGPSNAAVAAGNTYWQTYKSGVLRDTGCPDTFVDHAVLLVGYGQTDDGDWYYIIKNSWLTSPY